MNDLAFLHETEELSGERVSACYQCYKCSIGCPVVTEMDIYPHRVIRYIVLGEREKALKSKTIWTCLQCMTCSVRCPNDIDIAHVFDTLRKVSVREGAASEKDTWLFDSLFIDNVRKHGRLHEIEMIMQYKLYRKDLFSDARMGMGMFLKGRMGVLPHNIKEREGLKEIFKKIEDKKKRG